MKNLVATMLFCVAFSFLGFAQNSNNFFILEKTGKQRMLCEQMTKNYLMILADIKIDEAKIELDQAKLEFNENLLFLENKLSSDVTKSIYNSIAENWLIFNEVISTTTANNNIEAFMILSNSMSNSCNDLTSKVYSENDFKKARILNLCNKQKMNTQKIAKNLLLLNSAISNKDFYLKQVNECSTSFGFSLSILKNSTVGDQLLLENIKKTEIEWLMIKESLNYKNTSFNLVNALSNINKISILTNKFGDLIQTNIMSENKITKL